MEMYWERQLLVFVAWSAHYNGKWGGVCMRGGDDNGSMASSCVSK